MCQVIETFQLKISEDQLMSRCTKCNGSFIQKPLSTEEAIQAAKGFQRIPSCLFNKNLEFWQCMDCHQLYWEVMFFNSSASSTYISYSLLLIMFFLWTSNGRLDLLCQKRDTMVWTVFSPRFILIGIFYLPGQQCVALLLLRLLVRLSCEY